MSRFIYFSFLVSFSFVAFGIEISDDLFIEDEGNASVKLIPEKHIQKLNISKIRKTEKVIIKKNSNLEYVVKKTNKDAQFGTNTVLDQKSLRGERQPASEEEESLKYVDYGDYEIHWGKKNK